MTTRRLAAIAATTTLTVLLSSGISATASAQATKPRMDTTYKQQPGMGHSMDMPGMGGMQMGPHHTLAMAYRDNLTTFTRALQGEGTQDKAVDLDLARPAVAEMRRSYDQMLQHHKAQESSMSIEMKAPMTGMMQDMDRHVKAVGEHLTMLEANMQESTPDRAKVSEHAAAILTECDGMMTMRTMGMPKK
jgi:hypothetical protein